MGTPIVIRHKPCLDQVECRSSDGMNIHENGTGFCWVCSEFWSAKEIADAGYVVDGAEIEMAEKQAFQSKLTLEEVGTFPSRGFVERKIKKEICEFFGVKVSYGGDGNIDTHYYPYESGTAYKIRKLPKEFTWIGKSEALFGKEKFQAGGKRLVICEGEIDALSVAQASKDKYGTIYPVVALSTSKFTKSILAVRDWVRSFEEVVLCFDEDEAGQAAVTEAIRVVGIDKVKITKLTEKDANEVYLKHGGEVLMRAIWDATPYKPSGIITKDDLWAATVNYNEKKAKPYPACLNGLNAKLKGRRGGEITLLISGTGSGKSTLAREILLDDVMNYPNDRAGAIFLEEAPAETSRKMSGMALNRNPAKEEIPVDELKVGFDTVFGNDHIMVLDHQGSMNDGSIVEKLEYMILNGCTTIILDHLTILVSEGVEKLEGNAAQDKVMNDLLRIVKKYPDVWIGLISHLRKAPSGSKSFEEGVIPSVDDIRGSGSVKQISFDIVAFARNLIAKDQKKQNTIKMSVLKCRYTGLTGRVPGALYDYDTGRLSAVENIEEDEEEFTSVG